MVPASYSSESLLDVFTPRQCKVVELINDTLAESTEDFTFNLRLSDAMFSVVGNFEVVLPETIIVIEDDDAPPSGTRCYFTFCE